MLERIIDCSGSPTYLRTEYKQLVLERKGEQTVCTPLVEATVVILANPQITCTHSVLTSLMECGGVIVVCDKQSLPVGMMLPIHAHTTQSERFSTQASVTVPTRKRLWKQIIQAKVKAQASLLKRIRSDDFGIGALVAQVRSGDTANIEAQASRRYWPALFDDPNFRRRRELPDQNRFLNYGYAVLRAIIARAICGVGLHPSLGVHHHNRYNPFCLADDLMEPYRPIVDEAVVDIVNTYGADASLDKAAKQMLLEVMLDRYHCEGEARTLFDHATRTASSLVKVFMGEAKKLYLADGWTHVE